MFLNVLLFTNLYSCPLMYVVIYILSIMISDSKNQIVYPI